MLQPLDLSPREPSCHLSALRWSQSRLLLHNLATFLHIFKYFLCQCLFSRIIASKMPIFHDPHDSPPRRSSSRNMSPGGGRGATSPDLSSASSLLQGLQPRNGAFRGAQPVVNPELHGSGQMQHNFDRMDLIERLKRTKSPVWQQDQNVGLPVSPCNNQGSSANFS